jgi:hypothetical protein
MGGLVGRAVVSKCTAEVQRSQKLFRQLTSGLITFNEYAYNVSLTMVSTCEGCKQAWVSSVPYQNAVTLLAYFQDFLVSVDYMPCPKPFIAGSPSDEEIERKQILLRPQYKQLYEIVKAKVSEVTEAPESRL